MTSVSHRYNHSVWAGVRRWLFYFLVLNAAFALPMLVARKYGYAHSDGATVVLVYVGGTVLAMLGASAMLYRFTRTRDLLLDSTHLVMPHYLWPSVRLERITAVHVDPRQPGVLLLGVDRQLPRYIHASALSPATTADALAACVRAAVAGVDATKAQQLERASQLAARSRGLPWACLWLAAAWLAIHALAWHAGSRFDDLDLLASGAYLHSLVLQGDLARVLDASLLHAHVPHLLSNVAALLMLGATLERLIGWPVLVVTHVVSATVAILGAGWLAPELLHVGASGGLFGLIGMLVHLRTAHPGKLPAGMHALPPWLLLFVVALSLGAWVPGTDWLAHAIGLVSGICISMSMSLFRMTGSPGSNIDAPLAATGSGAFRTRTRLPAALAICAVTCTALAGIDVSRRLLATGNAARLATLEQLAASHPNPDVLNAVAWRSVVIGGEFPSMARPLISAFIAVEPLTPAQRDTLAALHLVAGSASNAADEQLTALLDASDLPQQTQAGMAARLAAYVQRADSAMLRKRLPTGPSDDRCMRTVEVLDNMNPAGRAQTLRVQTLRSAPTPARTVSARWLSTATHACDGRLREWNLDDAAWNETQWIARYR